MEQRAEFLVQGSAPDPYAVTFVKDDDNLSAYCTCPAGENGQYCKHRFAILSGIKTGIISDNANEVLMVKAWLVGADVQAAMLEVAAAEREAESAKKRLTAAKKVLAAGMRD